MAKTDVSELGPEFRSAWDLLMRNLWIIGVGLIAYFAVILAAMFLAFAGIGAGFGIAALVNPHNDLSPVLQTLTVIAVGFCIIVALAALVGVCYASIAMYAILTGMANAAWERGQATFADGWAAFRQSGKQLFYAGLYIFLLALAALILGVFTLFLSLIAFYIFTLYVMPSIVVGKRDASDAIAESMRLTKDDLWPTCLVWLYTVAIGVVAAIIQLIVGHTLFIVGGFVAMVFPIVAACYTLLIIVGRYRKLTLPELAA